MAARRYTRDNRGRFASVGATARGGRLKTASGKKRDTQTERIAGGKPAGTIGKSRKAKPVIKPAKPSQRIGSVSSRDVPARAWRKRDRVLSEGHGAVGLQVKTTAQGAQYGRNINRVELIESAREVGGSFQKTRAVIATASDHGSNKAVFRAGNSAGVRKWGAGSQQATAFGGRLPNGNREMTRLPSRGRVRGGAGTASGGPAQRPRRKADRTLAKLASPELRSLSQERKIGFREFGNRKINRLMTAVRLENLTKAGKLDSYSPSQHRRAQAIHNSAGYTLRAAGAAGRDRISISRAIRANKERKRASR